MDVKEAAVEYLLEIAPQTREDDVPPGYKRTEVGVIPKDWHIRLLGELASIYDGTHQTPRYVADGVPFYSVEQVTSGDFDSTKYISKQEHAYLTRSHRIEKNDILMTRIGSIGDCKLIDWDVNASFYVSLALLKVFDACPQFVVQFSKSKEFKEEVELNSLASAIPKKINLGPISELRVVLPPAKEQRAIATALSDADALVAALQRLIAKKRAIKQGTMQALLTGRQRLPGFTGEWETKPMEELFSFSGGVSASREQLGSKGYCYLHYGDIHTSTKTVSDVQANFADIPKLDVPLNKVSRGSLLNDGDVVFVDASEDEDGASKHVVVVNPDAAPFISGLHTIVAKAKNNALVPAYCRYCFQTHHVKGQFRFFAVGTKVLGVSKGNIGKIEVLVPGYGEQTAIATVLSDMDAEIEALEARLAKTHALKAGMMQQLLTGRIRLPLDDVA